MPITASVPKTNSVHSATLIPQIERTEKRTLDHTRSIHRAMHVRYVYAARQKPLIKAKFHYASWFGSGSELVRSWFEAKFHYAIWFEPALNHLRTI